jgi:hypothetical protein
MALAALLSRSSSGLPPGAFALAKMRDHKGQALAYCYFELEAGRRTAANLLTKDEARRIATNIAKLPGLLKRPQY